MKTVVLLGLVLLTGLPSAAWAQLAAGSEFRVNTYTTGHQGTPDVAVDAHGNFVVVWSSGGQDGDGYGIFGRRFDAAGTAEGTEFQVNVFTTGMQRPPAVASSTNGDFVVVWASYPQDGDGYGVVGRRFSAAGVPQGSEFVVNSYTTGHQALAAVATQPSGNFVVVWTSNGQDGDAYGIFGRRFDAGGVPLGVEFQVNSHTTGDQFGYAVASDANGNFVVVWSSDGQDGSGFGIFGQRFSGAGAPLGLEFEVSSYTTSKQFGPSVASAPNGNFVVVWTSYTQDGSSYGVFGQRFDAGGVPTGAEFQVNSYTTGAQFGYSVASDAGGNFVVVWHSAGQDGSAYAIRARRFDASGVPLGAEFQVNSYTTGDQSFPAVASDPHGDFVVAWRSANQDGNSFGIFGQRYGDLIFQDSFESGDLTQWSSATTDGGDLSVSGAAGLAGTTAGLQALVDDTNALFVQDDTPNAETRYRARFYFDPNGFDPGEASSHFRIRIFIAFDSSGLRVATLVLKRQGGAYNVEARVRRNDGTRADTGFFPIAAGPHFIELDWHRATGPGTSDGSLQMWIDNTSVATLSGIDNDSSDVDFVRLGTLGVKTGAAGTLFFDQFESRRQVFIGPDEAE